MIVEDGLAGTEEFCVERLESRTVQGRLAADDDENHGVWTVIRAVEFNRRSATGHHDTSLPWTQVHGFTASLREAACSSPL